MTGFFEPILIDAILSTARAIGVVTGILVFFDLFSHQDHPPHDPKKNAVAWAMIALGCATGGAMMLYDRYGGHENPVDATAARALLWSFLATGVVMRASMRAHYPGLIWLSSLLIGICGFVFSLADRLIG